MKKFKNSKGERNGNSKLTWNAIREMRNLFATGKYTRRQLAEMFEVSYARVCEILRGDAWK